LAPLADVLLISRFEETQAVWRQFGIERLKLGEVLLK